MEIRNQRLCAYCGLGFVLFFLAGFLIAGFIPPPPPSASADEIRQHFLNNTTSIRLGFISIVVGAAFIPPWCAAIFAQVRHMAGQGAVLAYAQFGAGVLNGLLFVLPAMFWEVAAYRANTRSPELTLALNDIASLIFICPFSFGFMQCLIIAIATLQDTSPEPVFPRWSAYFNIWAGIVFAAGALTVFAHSGPFAWDGMFAYWIPLSVYCSWFVVMLVLILRSLRRQERQAEAVAAIDKVVESSLTETPIFGAASAGRLGSA